MSRSLEALISEKDFEAEGRQVFLGSLVTLRDLSQFLRAFGQEVTEYTLWSVSGPVLRTTPYKD